MRAYDTLMVFFTVFYWSKLPRKYQIEVHIQITTNPQRSKSYIFKQGLSKIRLLMEPLKNLDFVLRLGLVFIEGRKK